MANVDNIQHADAVPDSASARLGIDAEAIDAKSKSWSSEYRAKFTLALLSRDKIQRN